MSLANKKIGFERENLTHFPVVRRISKILQKFYSKIFQICSRWKSNFAKIEARPGVKKRIETLAIRPITSVAVTIATLRPNFYF